MEDFKNFGISAQLAKNLIGNGFYEFFPIQKKVIPTLLSNNSRSCINPRHICASAPTGSGKTLSYVVPILQALNRNITKEIRLRAIVILPTRELANQVYRVFCQLSKNMNVLISIITGQMNFEVEQSMLVAPKDELTGQYSSNIDILVCTAGRLQDHLQLTQGFTLKYLQFLVLDEADRLLANAYHNWVKLLIQATDTSQLDHFTHGSYNNNDLITLNHSKHCTSLPTLMNNNQSAGHFQRLLFSATLTDNPGKLFSLGIKNPLILKVSNIDINTTSISENLSENVTNKSVTQSNATNDINTYYLPMNLSQSICICETARRPLALIALLYEATHGQIINENSSSSSSIKKTDVYDELEDSCSKQNQMIIIFTSSVIMTNKLCKLLQLVNNQIIDHQNRSSSHIDNTKPTHTDENINKKYRRIDTSTSNTTGAEYLFGGEVHEISRNVKVHMREEIIQKCLNGNIKVLVSTDQMARGIDLPNVKLVINYDSPFDSKTYLHRGIYLFI